MVDFHESPCQCHHHDSRSADPPYEHCHYERRREENVGPFNRTTVSNTTDCHIHHPATPCPGPHRSCGGHSNDRLPRQRQCHLRNEDNPRELETLLLDLIDSRGTDSELRRLIDESIQRQARNNTTNQRVLADAVAQLLGQSDIDQLSPRFMNPLDGEIELDVLIDFGNSFEGARISTARPRRTSGLSRRDLLNLLSPDSPSRVPVNGWSAGGFGIGMAAPQMAMLGGGLNRTRDGSAWTNRVWR